MCKTGLFSVKLIFSPVNIRSVHSLTFASSASFKSNLRVSFVMRFFEKSTKMSYFLSTGDSGSTWNVTWKLSKREGSAEKRSRMSKPDTVSQWALTSSQLWDSAMTFWFIEYGVSKKTGVNNRMEVVTFQLGHYSNFVGTHFWNLQESNSTNTEIQHSFLFRENENKVWRIITLLPPSWCHG